MAPLAPRRAQTAEEAALVAAAARLFPEGTRGPGLDDGHKFVVDRASGSRLWDRSGNEYVDYLLGSGPHVLGHAHPAVLEALGRAAAGGTSHLVLSAAAIELAEVLCETVPCAEKVSFHSTGSEATFFSLRLARAATGRDKVLKFEGAFHGMHDYAMVSTQWRWDPPPFPEGVADTGGIPAAVVGEVLVAPYNDLAATEAIIAEHADELAAVIVEPMQRTFVPAPGFLAGVQRACAAAGAVLVFDEVVTGFRLALGGGQERYGVVPDLCAIGKTVSGGLPFAAICGRVDLLELADPLRRLSGEAFTMQTGTYSSNPLAMHVALAVIAELRRPGFYERLEVTGRTLMDGIGTAFAAVGRPVQVLGEPSAFHTWFSDQPVVDHRSSLAADAFANVVLTDLLLERGVLRAHEKCFVSAAHTDEDVAITLEAFADAAVALAEALP
ncbi:MAG TPA: aminotransferase class III-fold pyridoxal phosphate-dependent enzyme [Acidimicrobiales bacterium]|nr:aminotransferase class III-fold pyridoxal phosphate-dependent enzyme [Acidimicrobiales bacterium]